MATDAATTSALDALKQWKGERPTFVRVYQDDNTVAQIATPDVKRWKPRVATIIASMPWAEIEPLDSRGNVMGARQANSETASGAATDLEDLEELSLGSHTSLAGLLSLMLKAQDTALVRQKQAYDSVLDNNQRLLMVVSARLESMEKHAHHNFVQMQDLRNKLSSGSEDSEEGADMQVVLEALKLANATKEPVKP